jgi:hypothetical protein
VRTVFDTWSSGGYLAEGGARAYQPILPHVHFE